jgi:hypothetical protein
MRLQCRVIVPKSDVHPDFEVARFDAPRITAEQIASSPFARAAHPNASRIAVLLGEHI